MQAFGVRQMSIGFRLSLPMAAKWGGGLFLTGAVIGNLAIGIVMRKVGGDKCKISTLGKLALGGCLVGFLASFGFILRYSDTKIEGVDVSKFGARFDNSATNDLLGHTVANCQRNGYSDDQWRYQNGSLTPSSTWVMPVCGTRVNSSMPTIDGAINNFGPCLTGTYFPVCDLENGRTYYSPCFGGCDIFNTVDATLNKTKDGEVFPQFDKTTGALTAFSTCSCNNVAGHPFTNLTGTGVNSGIGNTVVVPGHCSDNPMNIDKNIWLTMHPHLDTNETWKFPVFWAVTAISIACFYRLIIKIIKPLSTTICIF